MRQENHLGPGDGDCSEPRSCHRIPAWGTRARFCLQKKRKKIYLWILTFKFYLIFMNFFGFFQPFKNVKNVLNLQAIIVCWPLVNQNIFQGRKTNQLLRTVHCRVTVRCPWWKDKETCTLYIAAIFYFASDALRIYIL